MDGVVLQGIPSEVSTDGVFHARQKIARYEMRVATRWLGIACLLRQRVCEEEPPPASGAFLARSCDAEATDGGLCLCVTQNYGTFPVNSLFNFFEG